MARKTIYWSIINLFNLTQGFTTFLFFLAAPGPAYTAPRLLDVLFIPDYCRREDHHDKQVVDRNDDSSEETKCSDVKQWTECVREESNCSGTAGNCHGSYRSSPRVCKPFLLSVQDGLVNVFTLVPSVEKDKDVICRNTQDNVNDHDLQEAKVFDLKNAIGDDDGEWKAQNDDAHSNDTQET